MIQLIMYLLVPILTYVNQTLGLINYLFINKLACFFDDIKKTSLIFCIFYMLKITLAL